MVKISAYLFLVITIDSAVVLAADGDWPMLRRDPRMTCYQPLAGAMKSEPRVLAKHFLGASAGVPTFADLSGTGEDTDVIMLARSRLTAYDAEGERLWESAPAGFVIQGVQWVEDLDGEGRKEVIALAANMGGPRQALLILDGQSGELLDAIKFVTGDFGRQVLCGSYLHGEKGKQIAIFTSMLQSETGPPRGLGTGGLWTFDGQKVNRKWSWEPKEDALKYHCAMVADLKGNGHSNFVIQSWCHVWNLDAATGEVVSHAHWDPQGANGRHYGWNILDDVDLDGKLDFVNISIAKHVDMLRNVDGKLELAWTHGWTDAVTTETRMLRGPFDPVVDVDGDGKKEVIAALFDGLKDKRWHLLMWDGASGEQKLEEFDLVPIGTVAVWGKDSPRALLVVRSDTITFDPPSAYEIWRKKGGNFEKIWSSSTASFVTRASTRNERGNFTYMGANSNELTIADVDGDGRDEFFTSEKGEPNKVQAWGVDERGELVKKPGQPAVVPVKTPPANLPALQGTISPMILAADVNGDSRNEVLLYDNLYATVLRLKEDGLKVLETIPSSEVPVVCDLLGDARPFILTAGRGLDRNLFVQARGPDKQTLWKYVFPNSSACGQWSTRPHNFVVGHFTGGKHLDVFTYSTKPESRSYVLDGRTGEVVWTRDEIPKIERHFHGWEARAAVYDYDHDGADDVLFCNPDFYCVGSGRTGDFLVGPVTLAELCKFWCAYASPVVLEREGVEPFVYLGSSYSSRTSISLDGKQCLWFEYLPADRWPLVQTNRLRCEALLPPSSKPQKRSWRAGQVESDGTFFCFEADTGKQLWKMELPTAASGMSSGDVDGDGEPEFLLGGQDGSLTAVRDAGDHWEILWQKKFDAPVGTLILADVNGDKKSEIIVSVGDGNVYVLGE